MSMSKPKYAPTLLVMVDPKGVRSVRGQRRLYDRIRPHLEAIDTMLAGRPSHGVSPARTVSGTPPSVPTPRLI